jgi:hypothetical protein
MRKAVLAAAIRSRRIWLVASIVVLIIVAAGACHSKATGGELVLTGATDPGANAFMPPAAPPPTGTLNADGSFSASFSRSSGDSYTVRGVFATDAGSTVIHDAASEGSGCRVTFSATKQ